MSDQIEIISPRGEITFYDLDPQKGVLNIGRHPDNDIVVDSPQAAPFHAVLDFSQKPYQVLLLSTDGGTTIGGRALSPEEPNEMHTWDTLEIAGYNIMLVGGVEGTDAVPPTAPTPEREARPTPKAAGAPVSKRDRREVPALQPVPDQTDDVIITDLSEREWTIDVEQTATCQLTITNGGDIVASFQVHLEGIDPDWVTIIPPQVNLNEGERATVTVSITPPREPTSRAGMHHLAVVVTSPNHPGRSSRLGATLNINPYYEFTLGELSPKQQTVGGRKPTGKTVVQIANKGNSKAPFRLEAMDDERALSFEFEVPDETATLAQQAEVRLPPEETVAASLHITPLSRRIVGLRRKRHSFTVTAMLLEGALSPRSLLGQLNVRPMIGPWLIMLLALLLGSLIVIIFRPKIYDFQVEPEAVMAGEPVTLSWRSSLFSNLRIESDAGSVIPPVEENEGQLEIYPEISQTFFLRANNILSQLISLLGRDEEALVVVIPIEPEIRVFSSDRDMILTGEPIDLRWEVLNAEEVILSVNGSEEKLLSTEHTSERRLTPSQNPTNYTLRATNRYGSDVDSLEITVVNPTPTPLPPPVIQRFSVAPLSVTQGQTVTIEWEAEGATKVSISNLDQVYPPNGTTLHAPPETTDYVLTAFYETEDKMVNTVSDPVTVIVNPKPTPTPEPETPVIEDFRVVPDEVVRDSGESIQLVWSVTGETTNIEVKGPELTAVSNLSAQGSLPVSADATTFFILTAYNGDLNASKTVELTVQEPTPTPEPSPTPEPTATPLPSPNFEQFVAEGVDDPADVTLVDSLADTNIYQILRGTLIRLRWSILYANRATLFKEDVNLQDRPLEGTYTEPETITQTVTYRLSAWNENDVETRRYVIIELKPMEPPQPPYNVDGPAKSTTPLTITWDYDPGHWGQDSEMVYEVTGFRIYRAPAPYANSNFSLLAEVGPEERQWADPSPQCGRAYYVTAVYEDINRIEQETDPSPDRWYSWPCATPTPSN